MQLSATHIDDEFRHGLSIDISVLNPMDMLQRSAVQSIQQLDLQ
jgi:hypothetical protein